MGEFEVFFVVVLGILVPMCAMLLTKHLFSWENLMRNLRLQFEDECYPVRIGVRCSDEILSNLLELDASSYHLITDRTVSQLHAGALCEQLSTQAIASLWVVDNGESFKSLETVEHLAKEMVQAGIDRASVIVAVGGGVIGNLAGLTAALLFRGIRLVHVPTTLIAAADSIASLKQAVNLTVGKNLLGCFHKPTSVLIDLNFLRTLPVTQIRSGMYEIIKNALIVAVENIPLLERGLKPDANYTDSELMAIVEAGLLAKQKVMKADKCERKEAIVFEYGHTVGHAIELAAEGRVPHGEAVGLGMIVAAEVASRLGRLSEADRSLHHRLLKRNGLTVQLPPGVTISAVMALLRTDNKRGYVGARPDQVAMILLDGLGVPAGPVVRPLVLVDGSLIQSCIEDCLTGIKDIAIEENRQ
ncbi:iron-containing alcohol dehydrogenase [Pseudomonas sp. C1C7]|uniref:2-deoxy-scyllo-inosose synthase n=1 Tax=Pseudomonas sp. C1C7 TaxID=2735272 RepID=UPI0015864593|nr:2-deoxy-scyllo-inosose synthase [Pseudomonas sp. C1C7]NUT77422.1 iron-containing alcohol dehydrogenase [Pseudomonas sp. C1C7]